MMLGKKLVFVMFSRKCSMYNCVVFCINVDVIVMMFYVMRMCVI